jgi:hypothetical protein
MLRNIYFGLNVGRIASALYESFSAVFCRVSFRSTYVQVIKRERCLPSERLEPGEEEFCLKGQETAFLRCQKGFRRKPRLGKISIDWTIVRKKLDFVGSDFFLASVGLGLSGGFINFIKFSGLSPGGVAQWTSHPTQRQKTRVRIPPWYKTF